MQFENKSKFGIGKVLVSLLIAIPLCLEVGFLSILALFLGMVSLPFGIALLLLGGLGCLYVYSLIASLWLDRRDGWIVFGLLEGILFLGLGAYNCINKAIGQFPSVNTWTTKNYFETVVLGPLAIAGILLSIYLLYKRMPNPSSRRTGGPIVFRHASVPEGVSQSATALPQKPPGFPHRRLKNPSTSPLPAEQDAS